MNKNKHAYIEWIKTSTTINVYSSMVKHQICHIFTILDTFCRLLDLFSFEWAKTNEIRQFFLILFLHLLELLQQAKNSKSSLRQWPIATVVIRSYIFSLIRNRIYSRFNNVNLVKTLSLRFFLIRTMVWEFSQIKVYFVHSSSRKNESLTWWILKGQ